MKIINGLTTTKYTEVHCEDREKQLYNAPHHFKVIEVKTGDILGEISFQEGPIKEVGVNGVRDEDLLTIVLTRLEAFQSSEFKCAENQEAINGIREALESLQNRTLKRYSKNVEVTSEV
jgi:hypothetical protein